MFFIAPLGGKDQGMLSTVKHVKPFGLVYFLEMCLLLLCEVAVSMKIYQEMITIHSLYDAIVKIKLSKSTYEVIGMLRLS